MDFLSFNELKVKLSDLYKRNVDNAETTHFIKKNALEVFTIVDGLYAGGYENVLTERLVTEIFQQIHYVELFEDRNLNSLMFGDIDKLSIDSFKKLFGIDSDCDGFIILPNDIYERMFIEKHVKGDDREFPLYVNDIAKYYEQSEVSLIITRNSICVSKETLEIVLDEPLTLGKEDFDDCAKLKGIHKTNRDARDRRGMARILAKYIEGKMDDKNYKLKDVADEVIKIMESFNLETIPKVDQIKGFIRNEVDPCAKNPGTNKRKVTK